MKNRTRRQFLKTAFGTAVALTAAGCLSEQNRQVKSPNLIIVFPDQMRGQAIGFLKEDPVITPNLDRFASESLVLPQAVSNYPVCSPYRAMLMTGKYPHANGVLSNCTSEVADMGWELKQSDRCWSDVLKGKGYSLGYIGKWHLDAPRKPYVKCENNSDKFAWNEWCPPARRHGFDFWYSYGTYDYHTTPMYWATDSVRDNPVRVKQWGPEHEADLAVKYIHNEDGKYRNSDKPFALVVSMNPPHMPYNLVPKKYVDMYSDRTAEDLCNRPNIPPAGSKWGDYYRNNIKNYFAMVTGVDEQFGRILDALKEKGIENDTIVVFTSDHGNCLGCHDEISKNNHYEESMRVPFIIRWPAKIKPRRDNLLFSAPDVYPTVMGLMGFGADIPKDVQGTGYAGLFVTGDGKRPNSQFYLWVPVGKPEWGRRGVRTDKYTFVVSRTQGKPTEYVLHDNIKDPYQLKNTAGDSPEIVARLTAELNRWLEKTKDPWRL